MQPVSPSGLNPWLWKNNLGDWYHFSKHHLFSHHFNSGQLWVPAGTGRFTQFHFACGSYPTSCYSHISPHPISLYLLPHPPGGLLQDLISLWDCIWKGWSKPLTVRRRREWHWFKEANTQTQTSDIGCDHREEATLFQMLVALIFALGFASQRLCPH